VEYIWMILRTDLMSVLNRRKAGKKGKLQLALLPVFWIGLSGGVYYGAHLLFSYLDSYLAAVPGMADAVALNLLNGLALYVIVLVFLSGFQLIFRIVYESDDIGFLLSQPVPSRAVFAAKFITAYTSLLPMVLVFGAPVWFAWGSVNRVGLGFYAMVMLSYSLLLLLVHSAVTLMLLAAMRYLPGARLKRLFVAVTALLGMFMVLSSQVMSSRLSTGDPMELLRQIESVNLKKTWYLPTTWSVNLVLGTLERFDVRTSHYAVPLACCALALAWLAVKMSNGLYFAGWSGLEESSSTSLGKRKAARRRKTSGVSRVSGAASARIHFSRTYASQMQGAFWTILRKDVKLLLRDPVLWYSLGTSAIALGCFAYNTMRGASVGGIEYSLTDRSMLSSTLVMMACIMGSIVGSQTGGVSLSREGSSFWLLQANPVDGWDLFRAKLAYAVLPSILLMLPFFGAFEFGGLPHYPLWRKLLVGVSISTIVALCQILLDVYFPDFTIRVEIGSSKSGRGTGKLLTVMFASMAVALALSVLLMIPAILVTKGTYPQSSLARLDAALHVAIVALAILMISLGNRVGSKQAGRLLRSD
jgi:ABC-2 type transport system permease protein